MKLYMASHHCPPGGRPRDIDHLWVVRTASVRRPSHTQCLPVLNKGREVLQLLLYVQVVQILSVKVREQHRLAEEAVSRVSITPLFCLASAISSSLTPAGPSWGPSPAMQRMKGPFCFAQ